MDDADAMKEGMGVTVAATVGVAGDEENEALDVLLAAFVDDFDFDFVLVPDLDSTPNAPTRRWRDVSGAPASSDSKVCSWL